MYAGALELAGLRQENTQGGYHPLVLLIVLEGRRGAQVGLPGNQPGAAQLVVAGTGAGGRPEHPLAGCPEEERLFSCAHPWHVHEAG